MEVAVLVLIIVVLIATTPQAQMVLAHILHEDY